MASGRSRVREHSAVYSCQEKMNTTPFLVNALINDSTMIQALVDNGCLCSGIIDEALKTKLKLPRYPIPPQLLETAVNSSKDKTIIDCTTCISLDLDGHVTSNVWLYIVPHSTHQMIIGKKWLEDQDAVIHAREQFLHLRKINRRIFSLKRWRQELRNIARPKVASINVIKEIVKTLPVCKASLEDINKALRSKSCLTIEDVKKRQPNQVADFAHLFADDESASKLPPTRGALDHAINIKKEDGKSLTPPWGPMYSMSREELLVLRKTLTDLINKGWIRSSNSPAASPVLFVRKPNGGLRLCVDYLGLNAITVPDRYPLPLFKETLRQLSKAKWFSKLDVKSAFHRIRIRKRDEWMTAFRCRLGLFEWLVTPFGLVNAPATFQRYINDQIREHLDLDATAYMDDILAYTSGNEEDHWKTVRSILSKLDKAGLYLDIESAIFYAKE